MRDSQVGSVHNLVSVKENIYVYDAVVEDSLTVFIIGRNVITPHPRLYHLAYLQDRRGTPAGAVNNYAVEEIRTLETQGFGVDDGRKRLPGRRKSLVEKFEGRLDIEFTVSYV